MQTLPIVAAQNMLGILGLLVLVLGAFTAGGGAFNWEFFFSDGYREHGWARSLGRDGARGILLLLGGVLVVAGFVSQIVDAASKPVSNRAVVNVPAMNNNTESSQEVVDPAPSPSSGSPAVAQPQTVARQATRPAAPATGAERRGTATAPSTRLPGNMVSSQPVTIWNPDPAPEDMRTFLILQYRFEPGHQPHPGSQYVWVIDLQGVAHKVSFEGGTLEKQGQLTHLFDASAEGGGFDKPWATWIEIEVGGEGRQISNKLEIDGEEVRSLPLSPGQ